MGTDRTSPVTFKDHFSARAAEYGRARPHYPRTLFDHLAAVVPSRQLALDLATGNGQAAVGLADWFDQVLASDASQAQLAQAFPHPRVRYRCHPAEVLPMADGVADLVTIAQAAHWLDLPRVYPELRRVLRPRGVVALWAYSTPSIAGAADAALAAFASERVGAYWLPERAQVENGYRDLPFPFEPIFAPPLELEAHWTAQEFLAYADTWSSVARYRATQGIDPLPEFAEALVASWPADVRRTVRWPLHLRLGRVVPI